jgi:hypothetical protein
MKGSSKTLLFAVGSLVFAGTAVALPPDNPYQAIVERNVFGLGSPPPPPTTAPPPAPPVNITFTGITNFRGERRAWFLVPGADGKQLPVSLSLGERDGILELVDISEEHGEVTVLNSGKETRLNFKDHGNKAVGMPVVAAAGTPGAPRPLPGGQVNPAGMPAGVPTPGRPMAPTSYGTPAPLPTGQPMSAETTGLRAMPTRTLRLPGAQGNPQPATTPQPPAIDPAEQLILMEADRAINAPKYNSGMLPPLPPTPETPPGSPGYIPPAQQVPFPQ